MRNSDPRQILIIEPSLFRHLLLHFAVRIQLPDTTETGHRRLGIFSMPSSQYDNGLHAPSRIVGADGPQIIDISIFEPKIQLGSKELVWGVLWVILLL